jgi:hypothetical protein
LSGALHAEHITATHSDHFIENESPGLVIKQVCRITAPAAGCPPD